MQHRYSYCLNQIGNDLQLTKLGSKACLGDKSAICIMPHDLNNLRPLHALEVI